MVDIRPIAKVAQNLTSQSLDTLKVSRSLYNSTLSQLNVYKTGVETAIRTAQKEVSTIRFIFRGDVNEGKGNERRKRFEEMSSRQDTLDQIILDLRTGLEITSATNNTLTRLQTNLDTFIQTIDEIIGAQEISDGRCGVVEAKALESFYIQAVFKAVGNNREGRRFSNYYHTLPGSSIGPMTGRSKRQHNFPSPRH